MAVFNLISALLWWEIVCNKKIVKISQSNTFKINMKKHYRYGLFHRQLWSIGIEILWECHTWYKYHSFCVILLKEPAHQGSHFALVSTNDALVVFTWAPIWGSDSFLHILQTVLNKICAWFGGVFHGAWQEGFWGIEATVNGIAAVDWRDRSSWLRGQLDSSFGAFSLDDR